MISLYQKVYGDPDDVPVMTKLFRVPLDVLLGALPKLKLDGEARYYSWCHENGSFIVHFFNLTIPQYTDSWGNRSGETRYL